MLFNLALEQAARMPHLNPAYANDAAAPDIESMLKLISAVLERIMGTPAGFALFLNEKVNDELRVLLDAWGAFLTSPASCAVLHGHPETGWFGRDAMHELPDFDEHFVCDPAAPHHGFKSWDDFSTREYRAGVRPVAHPDDDDVIANACESAPYRISSDA